MPLIHNVSRTSAKLRIYGVGVDAWDAFADGATLYHSWSEATHKKNETYGTDVFTLLVDVDPANAIKQTALA